MDKSVFTTFGASGGSRAANILRLQIVFNVFEIKSVSCNFVTKIMVIDIRQSVLHFKCNLAIEHTGFKDWCIRVTAVSALGIITKTGKAKIVENNCSCLNSSGIKHRNFNRTTAISIFGKDCTAERKTVQLSQTFIDIQNAIIVVIYVFKIRNAITVCIVDATKIDIGRIVVCGIFQIIDRVVNITIRIRVRSVHCIINTVATTVVAAKRQTAFIAITRSVTIAVSRKIVGNSVAIGIYRRRKVTTVTISCIERIDNPVTVCVGANCW